MLAWYLADLPDDRPNILAPHSSAGAYVLDLSGRRDVVGHVFVGAILPAAAVVLPVAPSAMLPVLRGLAGADGRLPPWTPWWDEEIVAGLFLFPSGEVRARVEAEQSRPLLSYFTETVDVADGWSRTPSADVAFGYTYHAELAAARTRGQRPGRAPAHGNVPGAGHGVRYWPVRGAACHADRARRWPRSGRSSTPNELP